MIFQNHSVLQTIGSCFALPLPICPLGIISTPVKMNELCRRKRPRVECWCLTQKYPSQCQSSPGDYPQGWLSASQSVTRTASAVGWGVEKTACFSRASTSTPFFKEPDTFILLSVASGSHCVVLLGLAFFLGKGSDIHLWNSTIKRATVNTE